MDKEKKYKKEVSEFFISCKSVETTGDAHGFKQALRKKYKIKSYDSYNKRFIFLGESDD